MQGVVLQRIVEFADPRRVDLLDINVAPVAEELVPSFAEEERVFATAPEAGT